MRSYVLAWIDLCPSPIILRNISGFLGLLSNYAYAKARSLETAGTSLAKEFEESMAYTKSLMEQ